MIAGRVRDHAGTRRFIVQRPHRIAGATELECTHALQVFGLEVQLRAGQCIQRVRLQHGRDPGMGRDACGGRKDVFESRQGVVHAEKINASTPLLWKRLNCQHSQSASFLR